MTRTTCRLTAKNRDQLRNPTLGNRVWATFTFTVIVAWLPIINSQYHHSYMHTQEYRIGHIVHMQPTATYVTCSVVLMLGTWVSPAKQWNQWWCCLDHNHLGSRNNVLDGMHIGTTWWIRLNDLCVAPMQYYEKIGLGTSYEWSNTRCHHRAGVAKSRQW